MSSIAIMQPYLWPYLGYYQLIRAADTFVFFDDVNYINRGWINRNSILLSAKPHRITVPLLGASQNRLISEIAISYQPDWRHAFMKTLQQAYARAPFYADVRKMLEEWIRADYGSIADMNRAGTMAMCRYLGLTTSLVPSSAIYGNRHLKGQERIIDICRQEGASTYINAIGGVDLYDRAGFEAHGIDLRFLRSHLPPYAQGRGEFVPNLSILDCVMFVPVAEIGTRLEDLSLVTTEEFQL